MGEDIRVPRESQSSVRILEFREGLYTYREAKSATLIGVYVLLFIASTVGNIAVLKFVLPFRRMRSVTHYFIINLAAADLLCTSTSLCLYSPSLALSLHVLTNLISSKRSLLLSRR